MTATTALATAGVAAVDILPELERQAPEWASLLNRNRLLDHLEVLGSALREEHRCHGFFPPRDEVFAALRLTPPARVRVVILGQDPYHQPGYAHGLAFSVRNGNRLPASLRNIFKELSADLGVPSRSSTDLSDWARQGVLLLNTVLTVRPHTAGAHRGWGWEVFTDEVIRIAAAADHVAFVLWGAQAHSKEALIPATHLVLASPHPSPLSAHRGFLGSRPFSRIDAFMREHGREAVDWVGTDLHELNQFQLEITD